MRESSIPINNQRNPSQHQANLCIDINRLHDIELDEGRLRSIVAQILLDHQVESAEISIAVVSDEQIHQLNRNYLQHDFATDVLSFNLGCDSGSVQLAGEVIVSADTAIHCAAEYSIDPIDELSLYVIHGTLHLVGHDDVADDLRIKMRQAEQRYAELFGLNYCHPDQISESMDGAN